jgi:cytosine/adenosine deaminase-related metal-dependent hydrolase
MEEEQVPSWFVPALKNMASEPHLGMGVSLLVWDSIAIQYHKRKLKAFSLKLGIVACTSLLHTSFADKSVSASFLSSFLFVSIPQEELPWLIENAWSAFDAVGPLTKYGLLGPDILLSHCNGMVSEEKSSVLFTGALISSTPTTELQVGLGDPVCFQDDIENVSSLGIDCHSATSASIVDQARLALQFARRRHNQHSLHTKSAVSIKDKTIKAFNLATIKGAHAAGLGDKIIKIGSITVGRFTDLVFWDNNNPGMLAAAEQDRVATMIHHSSLRDIKSVMIDGMFRKRDGKLLPMASPRIGGCCKRSTA